MQAGNTVDDFFAENIFKMAALHSATAILR
jgi:hypothetical protein